ncbi:MAG TPA: hypothetical protein VG456_06610 [Candidatus Sulfopaludibacter sp.]|jgi:hypothetical protein|nr:hypothetical protein [Candidatus Sulfopaludibacter sp.]
MLFPLRREFPAPSLPVFFGLQALDVVTTLLGLRVGASEASFFVGQLMKLGPVEALLISKTFAVLLACAAIRLRRPRLIVFLNYWFAVVITWNLATIIYSAR